MRRLGHAVRLLLGLDFLVNGLNFYHHFLPITVPADPTAREVMAGLVDSGIFDVVKNIEILAGLALLANRFVPLAVICIAPLVTVIFMVDCLLVRSLEGWAFGGTTTLLELAALVLYGRHFLGLIALRAAPQPYGLDDLARAVRGGVAVLLLLAGSWAPAAQAAPSTCERSCLAAIAEDYWSALEAHQPARLPLAAHVRYTENNVVLKPGQALWATFSGGGPHDILFTDPENGQVALTAVVEEGSRPAVLFARLRVEQQQVTEIETLVARRENTTYLQAGGWNEAQATLLEAVAPAARAGRAAMIGIAQSYFDRLTDQTLPVPPLDPRCNRVENGVRTTNNPDPFPGVNPAPLSAVVTRLSCAEQFALKSLGFVSRVRDRRYAVIDQADGLILGSVIFDHDGVAAAPAQPGAAPAPPKLSAALPSPYSYLVAELFKLEAGKIVHIQAALVQLPYGMASAW